MVVVKPSIPWMGKEMPKYVNRNNETDKGLVKLEINPDFQKLIPKLSVKEKSALEDSLQEEGCRDALVVWNETVLDGQVRPDGY